MNRLFWAAILNFGALTAVTFYYAKPMAFFTFSLGAVAVHVIAKPESAFSRWVAELF